MLKSFQNVWNFNRFLIRINKIQIKQIKTDGTKPPNLSPKKVEDRVKKQILFYIDNELPDKQLDNDLKPLKQSIKAQSEIIRKLKSENANKEMLSQSINELLLQQATFRKKISQFLNDTHSTSSLAVEHSSFDLKNFEELIKSRFFYDNSFTIYEGLSGFFDLGPLGCLIQNNIINEWRKFFVLHDKMLEVDCSILTPEIVLKASGHVKKFADIMVRDELTNEPFRADHLLKSEIDKISAEPSELKNFLKNIENCQVNDLKEIDRIIDKYNIKSPSTGNKLQKATFFNLMFQTKVGANELNKTYLRPETAQGIFTNFQRLFNFNHRKLPLIVAQVGKSFRNEINPKNGLIRQREFLMAEIEHFLDPALKYKTYDNFQLVKDLELNMWSERDQLESRGYLKTKLSEAISQSIIKSETLAYYIGRIFMFAVKCGINKDKIRFRQHLSTEMAHYANECWDLECETSFGWIECAGIADRCDYDLKQHSEFSGKLFSKKNNSDDSNDIRKIPHVIEPSFGIGRIMYTILEHNYKKRSEKEKHRVYFSFPFSISPYKCCILPLNESEKRFQPIINQISNLLNQHNIMHRIDDESGSIGKRYWRNDESGIAYAITLDYDTFKDECVTLRDRDTMKQIRVKISDLPSRLHNFEQNQF